MIADTRLVIFDGILGSGKSTMARFATRQIRRHGGSACRYVTHQLNRGSERNRITRLSIADMLAGTPTRHNPTQMMRSRVKRENSPRETIIWDSFTPAEVLAQSNRRWQSFVKLTSRSPTVNVFDGEFFNGDFTGLFLGNASPAALKTYIERVEINASPINPLLVYMRHPSVPQALHRIATLRGDAWLQYQLAWKLSSPYAKARGLHGEKGWVKLYEDYREVCDTLIRGLSIPKLQIEVGIDGWHQAEQEISRFLGCERVPDLTFCCWRRAHSVFEKYTLWRSRGPLQRRGNG